MDQITHEIRLENWKSIIEECHNRPEDQSARQWLKEHNINEKQYYYWQRKARIDAYSSLTADYPVAGQPSNLSFTEIPVPLPAKASVPQFKPDAVIRTAKVTVELSNTISDALLSRILGGLANAE